MSSLGSILVVDDEEEIVRVLSDYFTERGYAVDVAMNGGDALMLAQLNRPDAVILDIRLPDTNGDEILRQLRVLDETIPTVMLSGLDDEALARRLLKEGAFDYVRKPFDFERLESIVSLAVAVGREKPRRGVVLPFTRERRPAADAEQQAVSGPHCSVCGRPIQTRVTAVMEQGELMHGPCWRHCRRGSQ
jgi:DNA-binding response OmpR family regulator